MVDRVMEVHVKTDVMNSDGTLKDSTAVYTQLAKAVKKIVKEALDNCGSYVGSVFIVDGEIESPEAIIICKFVPTTLEKIALDTALDKIRSFILGANALHDLKFHVINGNGLHCFPCFCNIEHATEPAVHSGVLNT